MSTTCSVQHTPWALLLLQKSVLMAVKLATHAPVFALGETYVVVAEGGKLKVHGLQIGVTQIHHAFLSFLICPNRELG